jgi:hypothetical protein
MLLCNQSRPSSLATLHTQGRPVSARLPSQDARLYGRYRPDANHIDEAAKLVSDYYTKIFVSGMSRTGSRFDDWAGRGDAAAVANCITPDGLIAVSFLSVDIPSRAAVGILETYKDDIAVLLTRIPTDIDLADVKPDQYARTLGKGSPADTLWHLLRGRM